MTTYTRGEVIWLLSLTRAQAIDLDAGQRDSCAGLADTTDGGGVSAEDPAVLTIARWHDVQRAKREVVRGKEGLAINQMMASGFSEREIARLTDRDRLAIRRRWRATVDEILEALGGVVEGESTRSHINMCLICGEHPRAYLEAVRVKVRGGHKTLYKGRYASVCVNCLSPELRARIMGELAAAA